MIRAVKSLIFFIIILIPSHFIHAGDVDDAKLLLAKLYKEPLFGKFTYFDGRNRDVNYWKKYYSQFFTQEIVDTIVTAAMTRQGDPICFMDIDPRFFPVSGEYSQLLKISIGQPIIELQIAKISVHYTTSDSVNINNCTTVYFIKKTDTGWRISEQWLGAINFRGNWKTVKPNLIRSMN